MTKEKTTKKFKKNSKIYAFVTMLVSEAIDRIIF